MQASKNGQNYRLEHTETTNLRFISILCRTGFTPKRSLVGLYENTRAKSGIACNAADSGTGFVYPKNVAAIS
jgi:hypothetical protein